MIKYHKAKDINGNIVSIEDAQSGAVYYCIGCGAQMIVRKGSQREHHFSHKQTVDCNEETYIHKLAKQHIKELFDSSESFWISYKVQENCCKKDGCLYRQYCNQAELEGDCIKPDDKKFDLKQYYDTCQIEAEYEGFVADVLLSSSAHPKREPCFIEIAVTHPCNEEKLKSGIRIIEIFIPKDSDDLSQLSSLVETEAYFSDKKDKKTLEVKFHNFKQDVVSKEPHDQDSFSVFFIDANGVGQVEVYKNMCSRFGESRFFDNGLPKIHFACSHFCYDWGVAIWNLEFLKKNILVGCRNCKVCCHSIGDMVFCKKKHVSINYPSEAKNCPNYYLSERKAKELAAGSEGCFIWVWPGKTSEGDLDR